ncbi:hypothetical protein DXH95_06195 [Sphingorhabdus pulchriflava]|uniref:DUF11 domain-containing protein n=1 Tax=Sphingorhabdus pulchriflava TaxID=2292257 RepID=A0A371BJX8_9SPHN|nr:hypothetical protein [Sphingorhabdus pulchriflava]RDV07866.1 hypothetical protein DXH95_06195 [Sphingorhabdus pulchriflava]
MKHMIATLLAFAVAAPAISAPVELASDVFVEREQKRPDGTVATVLEAPKLVVPGDQLVFVVRYKNVGTQPASNFIVTNPIPRAVAFSGTMDGTEVVSVDGGKSWGTMAQLKVAKPDGSFRQALPADVTHLKWNMNQTLAAGSAGKLVFRGVVR